MSELLLPRDRVLVRAVRELEETIYNRKRTVVPITLRVPGYVAYQSPGVAPAVDVRGVGNLVGAFHWANTFVSTYSGSETPLSATLADTAASESVTFEGPRSLDPMHDKVRLYRKLQSEGVGAYKMQAEFANPTSGMWTYAANTQYIGDNRRPLYFRYTVMTVCGVGWRLLRIKLAADLALSAHATNYWQFWLSRMVENGNGYEVISSVHDTRNIGFQTNRPFILTPRVTPGGVPTDEYDFLLLENDRIEFNVRGIGSVTGLPNLTVTLGLVHEEA